MDNIELSVFYAPTNNSARRRTTNRKSDATELERSAYRENQKKIEALDAKIESGVTTTSVDGTTVTISIAEYARNATD